MNSHEEECLRLFQQLAERLDRHELEESTKLDRLIEAQQTNTQAISDLTRSVSVLVEDTSAVVQLHKDLQSAARVGKGVQGFMLWCLKWGAIGAGVVAIIKWITKQFQ